jgi:diaminopimelate decarboxylase
MVQFKNKLPSTKIIVETGRFVVGKCGFYITKVLDRKESMGKTYIILNNTLNGFIRPSLSQLVMHYAQGQAMSGSEPLFTEKDAFQFIALTEAKEPETVSLVGNLCTSTDVVAEGVAMPKLKCGDIVVITNAGSYGAVLSPFQFSSQQPPAQLILHKDGRVSDAML